MPIFPPPQQPDLNKAPVEGMTPQLQAQIQALMAQNPELYPQSAVGNSINPSELNAFNKSRAAALAGQKPQPQGLAGIAPPPGIGQ